ncbi:hypothetical protein LOZ51_005793 [Ophidiomyces ophidiicola]|nr:hypothetical protein LOZ55_003090 [Ophidiomyces ophidiicola]KAI1987022.1 hypothetical protein LOZ51_005793 [Ophidiomyces ophidiicola]KAI1989010.1 hypothetical protein LOZ54_003015 [Ophidiomyces ophidiicola]
MELSSDSSRSPEPGLDAAEAPAQLKYPDVSPEMKSSEQSENSPAVESSITTSKEPLSAPERDLPSLPAEEDAEMFRTLKAKFEGPESAEPRLHRVMASLELVDKEGPQSQKTIQMLRSIRPDIYHLWKTKSMYMSRATEVLANASRDQKWRWAFGKSEMLDFYLRVINTRDVEHDIHLHALRLIGNTCADTDENRQKVVERNYTLPIIGFLNNSTLYHVAIPVIYNICIDFEPAQKQSATNGITYSLLQLLVRGVIQGEALLNYAYELIEISSDQKVQLETPTECLPIILNLAMKSDSAMAHFLSITAAFANYSQQPDVQDVCISEGLVEQALLVFSRCCGISDKDISSDDQQALSLIRLKLTHTLSDLSGLPLYTHTCHLTSIVTGMLIQWLKSSSEPLKICAAIMLGNLARCDEICESMVQNVQLHLHLIPMLDSSSSTAVIHAALGFLKNLAIPAGNKEPLGKAGLITSLSRLWASETVPQVQFTAASLTRLVVLGSLPNTSRLLTPLPCDANVQEGPRTYLSLLLKLFTKTDNTPTRIEIGRAIAAITRTLLPGLELEPALTTEYLVKCLFNVHKDVAHPIAAMIVQSDWPVLRSEGWATLALMAANPERCVAVADCLQNKSLRDILHDTIRNVSAPVEGEISQEKNNQLLHSKDREHVIIMLNCLSKYNPPNLSADQKQVFEDLLCEVDQSDPK